MSHDFMLLSCVTTNGIEIPDLYFITSSTLTNIDDLLESLLAPLEKQKHP